MCLQLEKAAPMGSSLKRFSQTVAAVAVLATTAAWAVPIGSNPNGTGLSTDVTIAGPNSEGAFTANVPDTPIELDPQAGPWTKRFGMPTGGVPLDGVLVLTETVTINGGDWIGWHEEIAAGSWVWEVGSLNLGFPVGLAGVINGTSIDFAFGSTIVGGTFTVEKELRCTGNPCTSLVINEWPTGETGDTTNVPEPGSLLLLGMGALAAGALRRRSSAPSA
jgi:hypothetical protein